KTEALFLRRLLSEVFGERGLSVDMTSSSSFDESLFSVVRALKDEETRYYVLIYNCESDSRVKSDILERHAQLTAAGHESVVGLLDLFPKKQADYDRFRLGLQAGLPSVGAKVRICLSVMEVEAWFFADPTHFYKLDDRLTTDYLKERFSLDYSKMDVEELTHPSSLLHDIYKSVGLAYLKTTGGRTQKIGRR